MKKLNNILETMSLCNFVLIACCVVMMLVMVLTQTGYYLTYDVWYASVGLVFVQIVIEIGVRLTNPEKKVEQKDRA